jgi:hypothetical protein
MNQKVQITKYVLDQLSLNSDSKSIRKIMPVWWQNPRIKPTGGLGLTQKGYEAFVKADIKSYAVSNNGLPVLSNKHIIWIDQFMDCPFFLSNSEIVVFGEKMAVQMVLFSGDVLRFSSARARKANSA